MPIGGKATLGGMDSSVFPPCSLASTCRLAVCGRLFVASTPRHSFCSCYFFGVVVSDSQHSHQLAKN